MHPAVWRGLNRGGGGGYLSNDGLGIFFSDFQKSFLFFSIKIYKKVKNLRELVTLWQIKSCFWIISAWLIFEDLKNPLYSNPSPFPIKPRLNVLTKFSGFLLQFQTCQKWHFFRLVVPHPYFGGPWNFTVSKNSYTFSKKLLWINLKASLNSSQSCQFSLDFHCVDRLLNKKLHLLFEDC